MYMQYTTHEDSVCLVKLIVFAPTVGFGIGLLEKRLCKFWCSILNYVARPPQSAVSHEVDVGVEICGKG